MKLLPISLSLFPNFILMLRNIVFPDISEWKYPADAHTKEMLLMFHLNPVAQRYFQLMLCLLFVYIDKLIIPLDFFKVAFKKIY